MSRPIVAHMNYVMQECIDFVHKTSGQHITMSPSRLQRDESNTNIVELMKLLMTFQNGVSAFEMVDKKKKNGSNWLKILQETSEYTIAMFVLKKEQTVPHNV